MNHPEILRPSVILLILCNLLVSCTGNNNTTRTGDTVVLNLRITHSIAVGWGIRYRAVVSNPPPSSPFPDSLEFGIVSYDMYHTLHNDNSACITFYNTGNHNDLGYLPAMNGAVSKKGEIWTISDIRLLGGPGVKQIFTGNAVINDEKAAFAWDYADSQVFYLDGLTRWQSQYLNRKITLEGELITHIDGTPVEPLIRNWRILE